MLNPGILTIKQILVPFIGTKSLLILENRFFLTRDGSSLAAQRIFKYHLKVYVIQELQRSFNHIFMHFCCLLWSPFHLHFACIVTHLFWHCCLKWSHVSHRKYGMRTHTCVPVCVLRLAWICFLHGHWCVCYCWMLGRVRMYEDRKPWVVKWLVSLFS